MFISGHRIKNKYIIIDLTFTINCCYSIDCWHFFNLATILSNDFHFFFKILAYYLKTVYLCYWLVEILRLTTLIAIFLLGKISINYIIDFHCFLLDNGEFKVKIEIHFYFGYDREEVLNKSKEWRNEIQSKVCICFSINA